MIKSLELCDPGSCLNKAAPDEPVFVLRAKDPRAAQAVRLWAAMSAGRHEDSKINEALALADQMDEWRDKFVSREPVPTMDPPSMNEVIEAHAHAKAQGEYIDRKYNRDVVEEAERRQHRLREALIGRRF